MDESKEWTTCKLTRDELEVIRKIRDTKYGTVEADIRNGNIIQIGHRSTFKPPSLEKTRQN